MSTLFVLVDAFRHDYLQLHGSAPFLDSCSGKGVHIQKVKPSHGFCERVEILTGVGFPENGFLTALGRSVNQNNPYGLLRTIPRNLLKYYSARRVVSRWAHWKKIKLQPYNIPLAFLPDLILTEDGTDHTQPHAFEMESLVDVLADAGQSIFWQFAALGMRNGTDLDRTKATIAEIENSEHDLYMLFLGALDEAGHKYGPESPQVKSSLQEIDLKVKMVFQALQKQDPEATLVVIGDHGMGQVEKVVDAGSWVLNIANELNLEPGRDFVYFLDSTMCRIWEKSDRFKKLKSRFIKGMDDAWAGFGSRLDYSLDSTQYGDFIWACNSGVLLFPDFFHQKGVPYQGMHGYNPSDEAMCGLGIVSGVKIPNETIFHGKLIDVAPTLCSLQGLPSPASSTGKPWIKRL